MNSFKVFYRNVFNQLKTTGSIAPSSRFLADAMLRCMKDLPRPLTILEPGSGTGPFTKPLADLLTDGDKLDLCELNDDFVKHLNELMDIHPSMSQRKDQITLYHKPVQALEGQEVYDVIISSLPFNNFEPELVQEILDKYLDVIKPGGCLSFFEYAGVRNLKKLITPSVERKRIDAVGEVLAKFLAQHQTGQIFVPLNIPPSIVHVCHFK